MVMAAESERQMSNDPGVDRLLGSLNIDVGIPVQSAPKTRAKKAAAPAAPVTEAAPKKTRTKKADVPVEAPAASDLAPQGRSAAFHAETGQEPFHEMLTRHMQERGLSQRGMEALGHSKRHLMDLMKGTSKTTGKPVSPSISYAEKLAESMGGRFTYRFEFDDDK